MTSSYIRVFTTNYIKGTRAREISSDAVSFLTPTKRVSRKSIKLTATRREAKTISNSSWAPTKTLLINKVNPWPPVAINQGWFIRNILFFFVFCFYVMF